MSDNSDVWTISVDENRKAIYKNGEKVGVITSNIEADEFVIEKCDCEIAYMKGVYQLCFFCTGHKKVICKVIQ